MKRIGPLLAAVTAVCVVLLEPSISTAAPQMGSAVAVERYVPEEDEAADLAALAKSLGISYDEAVAGYGGQSQFFDIVNLAAQVAPQSFASSEWLASGKTHGWISFTTSPPAEISKAIDQLPYDVTVTTTAPQSAVQADASLTAAHERLMSLGIGDFDLGFNVYLDTLVLTVSDRLPLGLANTAEAALAPFLVRGVGFRVESGAEPVVFQDLRGGEGFTWTGAICTTGFRAEPRSVRDRRGEPAQCPPLSGTPRNC